MSRRYYLADGAFLVGLEGEDDELLRDTHRALRDPVWPLSLGRKSFPPGAPVWLEQGSTDLELRAALVSAPRIAEPRREDQDAPIRLLLEHASNGTMRFDQPVAPFAERRFGPRYIATEVIHVSV